MSPRQSKILRFWKEIKRRHVHRSLAVYAGSAFVFLEAATIIFPRWGLPDWSIDLVLYLLILGALITIVVAWIFDLTPEGVQKTSSLEETAEAKKSDDSTTWRIATYISLAVIVVLIIVNVLPSSGKSVSSSIESLLFLPFDNFTGDENLEYLVSGIHSSLITDMQKVSALRVPGNATANSLKGTDLSLPQIATELSIDAFVEGALLYSGIDSVRVQVRLIRAFPKEKQLWAEDFRVAKKQILSFYNDITRKISKDINIVLTPEEEMLLKEAREVDPEAYEAYLLGQFYWKKLDAKAMQKAVDCFELAIKLDPDWADPYAGLANAWGLFGTLFGTMPKSVTLPKVYTYLNKALELDPNSAEAYYVKAINAVWAEFDWEKGETAFLKSINLNPNNALYHVYYSHLLAILRRPKEARIHADKALKLDPLKPLILTLATAKYPDMNSINKNLEKALAIDPNFNLAAVRIDNIRMDSAFAKEDYKTWIDLWHKKVLRGGRWAEEGIEAVMTTFSKDGHIAAIEEMLRLHDESPDKYFLSVTLKAERYLILGDADKAMDCLEKGFDDRLMNMTYIASGKLWEPLKDNPRYIALLKKMNLGSVLD